MVRTRPSLLSPKMLAAAVVVNIATTGCVPDLSGIRFMYEPVAARESGEPGAMMFADKPYCSAGKVGMALPGDLFVGGEWIDSDDTTDLHAVVVSAPDGLITAADLAGDERPETIATLSGEGIEMICVCTMDGDGEPVVTCADSRGDRWLDVPPGRQR